MGVLFGLGVFLSVHAVWISAVIIESFANPITIGIIALLLWLGYYSIREMLRRRKGFTAGFLVTFGILMGLFGLWSVIGIP